MGKKIIYNKLIRDKIPEIIEKAGKKVKTRVLDKEEYEKQLRKKLAEEAAELINAEDDKLLNELADVQELIDVILKFKSISKTKLAKFQKQKCKKRGGFKKKLFLEFVEEK